MPRSGFGFYWNDCYWGSLVIGKPQSSGHLDAYFGTVGAPSHQHIWLKYSNDELTQLGTRMKDPHLPVRPPPHASTSYSTQTLARFRATWDPASGAVTVQIADVFSGSAYSAAAQQSTRTQGSPKLRRLDVNVPAETRVIEGQLTLCRLSPGASARWLSTDTAYVPLPGAFNLGLAVMLTRRTTG